MNLTLGGLTVPRFCGHRRIGIRGAIDLETGQTRKIEARTIDAASTIKLLETIEALYSVRALVHVFLDNARYHHAKFVQDWLPSIRHTSAFAWEAIASPSRRARRYLWLSSPGQSAGSSRS